MPVSNERFVKNDREIWNTIFELEKRIQKLEERYEKLDEIGSK